MRVGQVNQLALASTPEGLRYCYRTFVEQDGPDKRLIRVKTRDNPHLPEGFIESLQRNYPAQLINAYLEGHFVNMASCACYPEFDRSLNYCDTQPDPLDTDLCSRGGHQRRQLRCVSTWFVAMMSSTSSTNRSIVIRNRLRSSSRRCIRNTLLRVNWCLSLMCRLGNAVQQRLKNLTQGFGRRLGSKVSPQQSNPLVQDRINAVNVLINSRSDQGG